MAVTKWPLSNNGLYLDREFAVVDVSTGRAITQKKCPLLSLVTTDIRLSSVNGESGDDILTVNAAAHLGMQQLEIILKRQGLTYEDPKLLSVVALGCSVGAHVQHNNHVNAVRSVNICGDRKWANEVSTEASTWFSTLLKTECALVRRLPEEATHSTPGQVSPFVNDAQFLLISAESVTVLRQVDRTLIL
jgi:uncharacterized protein YcbX